MDTEALASLVGNYTAYVLIAGLFVFLFRWTLKHFDKLLAEGAEREKNYQEIIVKLSDELPHVRSAAERIEGKVNTIEGKIAGMENRRAEHSG